MCGYSSSQRTILNTNVPRMGEAFRLLIWQDFIWQSGAHSSQFWDMYDVQVPCAEGGSELFGKGRAEKSNTLRPLSQKPLRVEQELV